jgi:hypothetical protein
VRRLGAALAALLLGFAPVLPAQQDDAAPAERDREALLRSFVEGQSGYLPFTTERAVPFLIRAALDRKLDEAGRAAGLDEGWNREAPEWQAADARADTVSHELESAFDMRATPEEARALLEGVPEEDIETLVAFQRSPVALRLVRAADLSLATMLVSTVTNQSLPPALAAARTALEIELNDRKADARITPEDQVELLRMLDKPVYARVVQAARQRLQARLQADNPMKRLDGLLEREAQSAIAAWRQRRGR